MTAAAATAGMGAAPGYPIGLDVDPPETQSRLSIFFRIVLAIPQLIVLYFLGIAQGVVTLIAWLAILFTGAYPPGLLRFSIGAHRWSARNAAYLFLLTGRYPPFSMDAEEAYPVRLRVEEQSTGRNRLTTFFRILMVIPQIIVLWFVLIAAELALLIAWLVGIFTGSVPAGIHTFLAGALRWMTRVQCYVGLLTDEYPPFALE